MPNAAILEKLAKLYEAEPALVPEGFEFAVVDVQFVEGQKVLKRALWDSSGTTIRLSEPLCKLNPSWFFDLARARLVRWLEDEADISVRKLTNGRHRMFRLMGPATGRYFGPGYEDRMLTVICAAELAIKEKRDAREGGG